MVLGMTVAGIGFSGIHPTGYPLISANISARHKGKVLGMWASAAKVGDTTAPLVIGIGILVLAWEWILIGISAAGLGYAMVLVAALRVGGFETRPPSRTEPEGTTAGASTDLFSNPQPVVLPLSVIVLFFLFIGFAGNGLMTFTPVFGSDVYGYSIEIGELIVHPESVANFYFSAMLISGAIGQLLAGGLADAYDHRSVLFVLVSFATVCLYAHSVFTLGPIALLIVFLVVGACIFGLYPARDALISDITPSAYEGRAFGYIFTIVMVGGSAFPVIIGYLADLIGIQASFTYLAVGAGGSLVCIALLFNALIYRQRDLQPAQAAPYRRNRRP